LTAFADQFQVQLAVDLGNSKRVTTGWDISPEKQRLALVPPRVTGPDTDFSCYLTSEGELVQAKVDR